MQRVGVNGDIKDGNQRNEKIQVPQARALHAHKGCEIAALHVDIAIYLQGRERREQAAGCLGAEPRCIPPPPRRLPASNRRTSEAQ